MFFDYETQFEELEAKLEEEFSSFNFSYMFKGYC
jgi:hypothetical protein